jgi:hypothetical protein
VSVAWRANDRIAHILWSISHISSGESELRGSLAAENWKQDVKGILHEKENKKEKEKEKESKKVT